MNEYCVMFRAYPDEPHRIPPKVDDEGNPIDARQWCVDWVNETMSEFPNAVKDAFYVAVRETSAWSKAYV